MYSVITLMHKRTVCLLAAVVAPDESGRTATQQIREEGEVCINPLPVQSQNNFVMVHLLVLHVRRKSAFL